MKKVFAILAVFAIVFLTMSSSVFAAKNPIISPTAEVITTESTVTSSVVVSESDTSPTSPQTGVYSGSMGAAAVAVTLFGAAAVVFGKKHKEQ